jgi:hypothetical protein
MALKGPLEVAMLNIDFNRFVTIGLLDLKAPRHGPIFEFFSKLASPP